MKVRDLIEGLKEVDGNCEVFLSTDENSDDIVQAKVLDTWLYENGFNFQMVGHEGLINPIQKGVVLRSYNGN